MTFIGFCYYTEIYSRYNGFDLYVHMALLTKKETYIINKSFPSHHNCLFCIFFYFAHAPEDLWYSWAAEKGQIGLTEVGS